MATLHPCRKPDKKKMTFWNNELFINWYYCNSFGGEYCCWAAIVLLLENWFHKLRALDYSVDSVVWTGFYETTKRDTIYNKLACGVKLSFFGSIIMLFRLLNLCLIICGPRTQRKKSKNCKNVRCLHFLSLFLSLFLLGYI